MRYLDFVDFGYEPDEGDLICEFRIEPDGISMEEAAGAAAAESSIGTWTELGTERPYVKRLAAKVFRIEGDRAWIAYPAELFEPGNMPNLLSSIAGNVFGLRALRNIRLEDVRFPRGLLEGFKGPRHGIGGIREILRVRDRPLLGTIIKPKLGLMAEDHAQVAYEAWIGGCDIVKDDENLSGQAFNPFEDRLLRTLEARDRAEEETGERKAYMVNITAETGKMLERAQLVLERGGEYAMVDVLTCGFAALQTLRERDLGLVIHAHRAGHAALTRNPRHGISMRVLAKALRAVGVDQLHIGAVVGKMFESRGEVAENLEALKGEMGPLKPVMPVASGGLHPALVPAIMEFFGIDVVIQAGGGIHGHPKGTVEGARAMRQAIEATLEGIPLADYARSHRELGAALEAWRA